MFSWRNKISAFFGRKKCPICCYDQVGCPCVDLSIRPLIFLFPDDNLSKCQWIFTKLDTRICIDIVEMWFGIANGQILSIFDSYLPI